MAVQSHRPSLPSQRIMRSTWDRTTLPKYRYLWSKWETSLLIDFLGQASQTLLDLPIRSVRRSLYSRSKLFAASRPPSISKLPDAASSVACCRFHGSPAPGLALFPLLVLKFAGSTAHLFATHLSVVYSFEQHSSARPIASDCMLIVATLFRRVTPFYVEHACCISLYRLAVRVAFYLCYFLVFLAFVEASCNR